MLIICPECGKEISDKAKACIHCGYPISSSDFYQVSLTLCGDNKVKVIKLIRQVMRLGLKEAADIANMLPQVVSDGLTYDDAKYIENLFIQLGATVMITQDNKLIDKNDIKTQISEIDQYTNPSENDLKPHCPYCNSIDLKKISGFSKVGNVALFGIFAASKVGKNYHCNNCKSNF